MHRSYEYHNSSYSMDDYLERLDRIQRMPSMIGDYPDFPNVHEVLNKKPTKKAGSNGLEKKVQFAGHAKKTAEAGKHDAEETSIDVQADGFIEKKRKGFALCKWDTFKVY